VYDSFLFLLLKIYTYAKMNYEHVDKLGGIDVSNYVKLLDTEAAHAKPNFDMAILCMG